MKSLTHSFLIVTCIVLVQCSSTSVQQKAMPRSHTITTCDTSVSVQVRDTLFIRLPVQISTGYSWMLDPASAALLRDADNGKEVIEPSQTQLEGGVETQVFTLVAEKQGTAQLQFAYRRSFEKGKAPVKTCSIRVEVR